MVHLIRTSPLLRSKTAHVNNMSSLYTTFCGLLVALKRSFVMLKNDMKVAPQTQSTAKKTGHDSKGKGRGILIATVLLSTLAVAIVAILVPDASCFFEVSFDHPITPFG